MENALEVLMVLSSIRDLHRTEANRLQTEMHNMTVDQVKALEGLMNNAEVTVEDLSTAAENQGKMIAISKQLKYMNEELKLLEKLISLFNGEEAQQWVIKKVETDLKVSSFFFFYSNGEHTNENKNDLSPYFNIYISLRVPS